CGRDVGRGRFLPCRHPWRARVSGTAALGQIWHSRRGGDLSGQRLHDSTGRTQDCDHERVAHGIVAVVAAMDIRIH
ncbi:hypothetical protein LCGC14_1628700, partial [marine sediment metagenome]